MHRPSAPRLAVLCLLPALAAPLRAAAAQQPSACVNATGPDTLSPAARAPRAPGVLVQPVADTGRAALRIIASVSADEVRFTGSPKVCVRLTGDAQLDSVHVLARRNLATPVVSGTTYRNVYVAVEIVGRLNAECIAARITGAPADSSRASRCASLDVQGAARGRP